MPTPTIPAGNLYMNATLYTGNGTSQSIVNSGSMQPDFIWFKSRSDGFNHIAQDSVRGVSNYLLPNLTNAEGSTNTVLTAFNSNGFSIGNNAGANQNASTYVAWQWKAGGTAVTNTSGSITSSVSANTTSGFSVVTYSGNNSANQTVGHGLGVAPSMVFYKVRNEGTYGWAVYHTSIGAGNVLYLNATDASGATSMFGSTAPTSTVLTVNNDLHVSKSGYNFVAYCWAEIAGFSKFGSYTGNGSTDGPFVYLGFRPRFVLIKATGSQDWVILDSSTNPYNVAGNYLRPNSSGAENGGSTPTTSTYEDFLSNGIKFRNDASSSGYTNASGVTYIYAAFAENPFKYANAR